MNYWPVWDLNKNVWLLGFILTWSGRASDYISELMGNMLSLLLVAEYSERLLELQSNYPRSQIGEYRGQSIGDLGDEIDDQDIEKMFIDLHHDEKQYLFETPNTCAI